MASEVEKKNQIDYIRIFKADNELFDLMTEYLKLKNNYHEPKDAEKFRQLAEQHLTDEIIDYEKASRLMKTAYKIIKACNGL
ncbi:MAG: hypothetical protein ACFFDW_13870 [Candidatus Thorarchaeota archaeon]